MIKVENKENCCGCTACYSICPKKAITMEEDNEGFKYPKIDKNKCINCGLCEGVCPVIKKGKYNENLKNYACQNKKDSIRLRSTSGGVFYSIADYIISNNGIVYAVGFDKNMKVIHRFTNDSNLIAELIGSKYVQSDLKDIFIDIKMKLKNNKIVFFVGTPCQVEGLINYLSHQNTQNLYTSDLMCYGVPSPKIYNSWISYIEKKYNSKVTYINFRDKKYGYAGSNTLVKLSNGKKIEDNIDSKSFLKTMFSHIGLRPSCYNCQFRTRKKKCDFTMGDMQNVCLYNKRMDDNKGTTFLQIHSEKGFKLFSKISTKLNCFEIVDSKYSNGSSISNIDIPRERDNFFNDLNKLDYNSLIKKYFPPTKKDFIANRIKPLFGSNFIGKAIIKRIRISNIKSKK